MKIGDFSDECKAKGVTYPELLIVIDDLISDIKAISNNVFFATLIKNRRHILPNKGMISLIITA